MKSAIENKFWQFDADYWFRQLNTSPQGLSQSVADSILHDKGIHPKSKSAFEKDMLLLLSQFKSPLVLLLIGASIISALLSDYSDIFIIIGIILSTGLTGFFQERNAGKVAEKLQALLMLKVNVLRDGKCVEALGSRIVPGDIIILNAGDMLPADCLIIESTELHANEASLTGESYPVNKGAGVIDEDTPLAKRSNCLWEGTSIISGNATALVICIGEDTILGNIKKNSSATIETAFEKGIKDFGFFLLKVTLILTIFILIVNLLNHKDVIESALFALALSVGMAPELLPAITTIAMSAGAKRMLDKKVIVKKLNSIQNLGEVNLLCTDKTGTITEGAVKIVAMVDGNGQDSALVKQLAFLNASFESGYINPIDEAIKLVGGELNTNTKKIGEIPYDFIRKRLSIAVSVDNEKLLITKGAFPQILNICSKIKLSNAKTVDITEYQQVLEDQYARYGIEGLRVLAIAYKNLEEDVILKESEAEMIFAGFILVSDPIKSDILQTIEALRNLKVDLKIITGDNKNVAKSITLKLGIKNPEIVTGKELESISSEALPQLAKRTHIFAEVEPQQKERIILALKKFHTIAYMGDGINDVSAINAADVGICVNNAVDVAREAADFVLMEQNLMVIAEGIKEGRKTFANTMKYIYINTGSTFGNMFSVSLASLMLPFLPMLPKQILLLNFLTSFPFLTVASDNVDEDQLMAPGKWNLKSLRKFMLIFGFHSSLFDIITFITLFYFLQVQASLFQTGWFVESMCTQLFIIFVIRTHKRFFKSLPRKRLFIFSVTALSVTIVLPYAPLASRLGLSPLPITYLGAMLLIAILYAITADLLKVWFFKANKHE